MIFILISFAIMLIPSNGYCAVLPDKYNRLSKIEEAKIILVGDSNIAFGFNSGTIEKEFHMPVVNVGLHGGLGPAFHTDIIKDQIRSGDIIIIAPADYNEQSLEITDCSLAWQAVSYPTELHSNIDRINSLHMLQAFPIYIGDTIMEHGYDLMDSVLGGKKLYSRLSFNEYGDVVYPMPECVMKEDDDFGNYFNSKDISDIYTNYLNEFNVFVKSKNATLLMSCPPILENTCTSDLPFLQSRIENALDFPMISQLSDYVYPLHLFYNTGLHLNDEGKVIRTNQLIEDLKKVLY